MTTKKKDFVSIEYTGYSQGEVFDSNIAEDVKKIDPKAKPKETIVIIGEGMVVPGLDLALEGKEVGKEYNISLAPKDAFGLRDRNLLKTIPLKVFTEQKISPYPGAVLNMDGMLAKIISISGARVMTDFNNPLAGKDVSYKFKVVKIISDDTEKAKAFFEGTFRFSPEFEVKGTDLVLKGPKGLDKFADAFKDKVKSLLDKDLKFEEKEVKPKEKDSEKKTQKTKEESEKKSH